VEVLLAIAVASAVLGGAFVSASQSFKGTRQSQERAEALTLLEGQLERLKAATSNDVAAAAIFAQAGSFCVLDTLAPQAGTCNQGDAGRYQLGITRTGNTFTAAADWIRINGGSDQIRIVYRVHQ
jgi:type II secretory pathway pseudopilin PulG